MPVKIRLMRIGAKKRPFYRIVAVDERKKRTGSYIESLGTYNPLTEPHEINLNQDRIDAWMKNGAVMSTGFLRILGKAPQRPPRKPKKEKEGSAPTPAAAAPAEAAPAEETPTEAPVETATTEETAPTEESSTQEDSSNEEVATEQPTTEQPANEPAEEPQAAEEPAQAEEAKE